MFGKNHNCSDFVLKCPGTSWIVLLMFRSVLKWSRKVGNSENSWNVVKYSKMFWDNERCSVRRAIPGYFRFRIISPAPVNWAFIVPDYFTGPSELGLNSGPVMVWTSSGVPMTSASVASYRFGTCFVHETLHAVRPSCLIRTRGLYSRVSRQLVNTSGSLWMTHTRYPWATIRIPFKHNSATVQFQCNC